MLLPPGETRNAVVTCYIPPNIDIGTKDKITFSSQGMNMASQGAMLTVTSPVSAGTVSENTALGKNLEQFFFRITYFGFCFDRIEHHRRYIGIMVADVMAEPKPADALAQFGHWKSQPLIRILVFYECNQRPEVY